MNSVYLCYNPKCIAQRMYEMMAFWAKIELDQVTTLERK